MAQPWGVVLRKYRSFLQILHRILIRFVSIQRRRSIKWLLILRLLFYLAHEVIWNHAIYWYIQPSDCLVFQWWKPIWLVHSLLKVQKEAVLILNQIGPVVRVHRPNRKVIPAVAVHHRNNQTIVDAAVHHLSNLVVADSLRHQVKRQILLAVMVLIKLKRLREFTSGRSSGSCFLFSVNHCNDHLHQIFSVPSWLFQICNLAVFQRHFWIAVVFISLNDGLYGQRPKRENLVFDWRTFSLFFTRDHTCTLLIIDHYHRREAKERKNRLRLSFAHQLMFGRREYAWIMPNNILSKLRRRSECGRLSFCV